MKQYQIWHRTDSFQPSLRAKIQFTFRPFHKIFIISYSSQIIQKHNHLLVLRFFCNNRVAQGLGCNLGKKLMLSYTNRTQNLGMDPQKSGPQVNGPQEKVELACTENISHQSKTNAQEKFFQSCMGSRKSELLLLRLLSLWFRL